MLAFNFFRRDNLVAVVGTPPEVGVAPGSGPQQVLLAWPGPDQLDGDGGVFVAAFQRRISPRESSLWLKQKQVNVMLEKKLSAFYLSFIRPL